MGELNRIVNMNGQVVGVLRLLENAQVSVGICSVLTSGVIE